jgi:GDPmannose 4,6-dehydratase
LQDLSGLPLQWRGSGIEEGGVCDGTVRVPVDPRYFRPAEVDVLQGDASHACQKLGWRPTIRFPALVKMMVEADCAAASSGMLGRPDERVASK